jgi:hypothetical protein
VIEARGLTKRIPIDAGRRRAADQAIITSGSDGSATSLTPWVGFGVFCLYAVTALGAAALSLVRRDA